MFTVQSVIEALDVRLDAKGSDYYSFDKNYKQAINESIKYIVNLVNYAFAQNKMSEEVLADLSTARVYTTSELSRILIDDNIWSIVSVNPLPLTEAIDGADEVELTDSKRSYYRPDRRHIDTYYFAKRLTKEEWESNKGNPFEAGNTVTQCASMEYGSNDNIQFAYLNPYNYSPKLNGAYGVLEVLLLKQPTPEGQESISFTLNNTTYSWIFEDNTAIGANLSLTAENMKVYANTVLTGSGITVTREGNMLRFQTDQYTNLYNKTKFFIINPLSGVNSGFVYMLSGFKSNHGTYEKFFINGGIKTSSRDYEITIRPYLNQKYCTLFVVETPGEISDEEDEIQLHPKLFNFFVDKCLNYISYQQGDGTNIFELTQVEIKSIIEIFR